MVRQMLTATEALVISSGLQGLAVTRALGERGVPVVVAHVRPDELAARSRYAVRTCLVPPPERDGEAFVDALLSLAGEHAGAVLIPTTDEATRDVARRAGDLARHYRLACPSYDAVARAVDKAYTYDLAMELGVPIPATFAPQSDAEIDEVAGRVDYPCLVKPRESHLYVARFGAKVAVVANPRELHEAHGAATAAGLKMLVQELIPGPDQLGVNYNAFRARGAVHAECTARKVRLSPPRFGMPRVVLSDDVPEVVEPAHAILAALDLEGFANLEFKRDPRDGTYMFFEVNCRHNHSSLLAVRCGLNFPYMTYRYALCGELPPPARATTGVYWIHEAAEIRQSATRSGREGSPLREIVRPWMHRKVLGVYDRNDPAPIKDALRLAGHRAGGRWSAPGRLMRGLKP